MTYEYINRFAQFGKVEYDVIISTALGDYRVSTKFNDGEDSEENKLARATELAASLDATTFENNAKNSIVAKVNQGGEFMKAYIASHPSITINDYAQINALVNNALSSLNIVLPQPDMRSVLISRVEDSIEKIKSEIQTMQIESDTESKVDTALNTILGALS